MTTADTFRTDLGHAIARAREWADARPTPNMTRILAELTDLDARTRAGEPLPAGVRDRFAFDVIAVRELEAIDPEYTELLAGLAAFVRAGPAG